MIGKHDIGIDILIALVSYRRKKYNAPRLRQNVRHFADGILDEFLFLKIALLRLTVRWDLLQGAQLTNLLTKSQR